MTGVQTCALPISFRPVDIDARALIDVLKPVVMGQNALDREKLNRVLLSRNRAVMMRPIGAVDVALWDIAGKAANMPIHRLIGTARERVAAYASSSTLPSIEAYLDQAREVKAAGYRGYKIHPPHERALHVPLIVAGPALPAGRRVAEMASLLDVTPTILHLLGLDHERERRSVGSDEGVARDLGEHGAVPCGEERVALHLEIDLGQEQLVGVRKRRRVDLGAPDHEHLLLAPGELERFLHGARPLGVRLAPRRVARDHDVAPARKRAEAVRQRLPGPTAHDDGVPGRQLAEPGHVLREEIGRAHV